MTGSFQAFTRSGSDLLVLMDFNHESFSCYKPSILMHCGFATANVEECLSKVTVVCMMIKMKGMLQFIEPPGKEEKTLAYFLKEFKN